MNRNEIMELTICILMVSLTLGTLGWFSTQQLEHGKQHTHYQAGE